MGPRWHSTPWLLAVPCTELVALALAVDRDQALDEVGWLMVPTPSWATRLWAGAGRVLGMASALVRDSFPSSI